MQIFARIAQHAQKTVAGLDGQVAVSGNHADDGAVEQATQAGFAIAQGLLRGAQRSDIGIRCDGGGMAQGARMDHQGARRTVWPYDVDLFVHDGFPAFQRTFDQPSGAGPVGGSVNLHGRGIREFHFALFGSDHHSHGEIAEDQFEAVALGLNGGLRFAQRANDEADGHGGHHEHEGSEGTGGGVGVGGEERTAEGEAGDHEHDAGDDAGDETSVPGAQQDGGDK